MNCITHHIFTNTFSLAWGNKQLVLNLNCVKMKASFFYMWIVIMSDTWCLHNVLLEICSWRLHFFLTRHVTSCLISCLTLTWLWHFVLRERYHKWTVTSKIWGQLKAVCKLCEGVQKRLRTHNKGTWWWWWKSGNAIWTYPGLLTCWCQVEQHESTEASCFVVLSYDRCLLTVLSY